MRNHRFSPRPQPHVARDYHNRLELSDQSKLQHQSASERFQISNFAILCFIVVTLLLHVVVHPIDRLHPQNTSHSVNQTIQDQIPVQASAPEPVFESLRNLSDTNIDPHFARYLLMLDRKRMKALTGRKFMPTDGDDSDSEEDLKDERRSKTAQSLLQSTGNYSDLVRLPQLINKGHNITRVSFMMLRVIVTYKIRSMVVVPCGAHSYWMGAFLVGGSHRLPKPFLYYCVDEKESAVKAAETQMPDVDGINVNFIQRRISEEPLPSADLVFSWDGLQDITVLHARALLDRIAQQGHHRYVLIASSPWVKQNTDDANALNLRRAPFSFELPNRIFKKLSTKKTLDSPEKQLYLYESKNMQKVRRKN